MAWYLLRTCKTLFYLFALFLIFCVQVNFVNNKLVEHPQTQAYKLIIQDSIIIQNITRTIRDGDTSSLPEEAKVKVCFKLE